MTPRLDWEAIFWEARGYLGLDEGAPIPREELLEQAKANGWSERDFQEALRETDQVVNVINAASPAATSALNIGSLIVENHLSDRLSALQVSTGAPNAAE